MFLEAKKLAALEQKVEKSKCVGYGPSLVQHGLKGLSLVRNAYSCTFLNPDKSAMRSSTRVCVINIPTVHWSEGYCSQGPGWISPNSGLIPSATEEGAGPSPKNESKSRFS